MGKDEGKNDQLAEGNVAMSKKGCQFWKQGKTVRRAKNKKVISFGNRGKSALPRGPFLFFCHLSLEKNLRFPRNKLSLHPYYTQ